MRDQAAYLTLGGGAGGRSLGSIYLNTNAAISAGVHSIQDQQNKIPGAHSVKKALAEFTKNSRR
jgi:hypothetical protein